MQAQMLSAIYEDLKQLYGANPLECNAKITSRTDAQELVCQFVSHRSRNSDRTHLHLGVSAHQAWALMMSIALVDHHSIASQGCFKHCSAVGRSLH